MVFRTIIFAAALLIGSEAKPAGMIEGVVENGTRPDADTTGIDVVLRAQVDGQLGIVAQTVADGQGRFEFSNLPLGDDIVYLPGANLDDVHFPGPRVRLRAERPHASVTVSVYDAVSSPNPLIIDDHRVVIRSQAGSITVRESLRINNPSSTCYVGEALHEGALPVTLHLGVPKEFERITFDSEAFGRQFRLIDEKLVTSLPWPPGIRELSFTYAIANPGRSGSWRRRLSLPCRHSLITVQLDDAQEASCNLPRRTTNADDGVIFESGDQPLAAGYVLDLNLSKLSVSMDSLARQIALLLFVTLALAVGTVAFRHRSVPRRVPRNDSPEFEQIMSKNSR